MKYLILEDFSGQPVPFLFPDRVDHADMREQLPYGRVLSAGYVQLEDGGFNCHGGSVELNAVAGTQDAAIIASSLS